MARHYFKQIIQALHHLHKEGIAHRDVKTENIIIDKGYNIKLADFGFSCRYLGTNKKKIAMSSDTAVGTPKTSAPEIVNPKSK
jgi:serine/threonine protein kinase